MEFNEAYGFLCVYIYMITYNYICISRWFLDVETGIGSNDQIQSWL